MSLVVLPQKNFDMRRDRATILKEIDDHLRKALELKHAVNELSPISRLLPELLLEIFYLLIPDDDLMQFPWWGVTSSSIFPHLDTSRSIRDIAVVSHVCQDWRWLALECPKLWSVIRIPNSNEQCVLELIKRSKKVPLRLVLDAHERPLSHEMSYTDRRFRTGFDCAMTEFQRMESISVSCPRDEYIWNTLLSALEGGSSRLRVLKLSRLWNWLDPPHSVPPRTLPRNSLMLPQLERLRLDGYPIPGVYSFSANPFQLKSLNLRLYEWDENLAVATILQLLRETSQLEDLRLCIRYNNGRLNDVPPHWFGNAQSSAPLSLASSDPQPVNLSQLKTFKLLVDEIGQISRILDNLVFPSTCTMDISSDNLSPFNTPLPPSLIDSIYVKVGGQGINGTSSKIVLGSICFTVWDMRLAAWTESALTGASTTEGVFGLTERSQDIMSGTFTRSTTPYFSLSLLMHLKSKDCRAFVPALVRQGIYANVQVLLVSGLDDLSKAAWLRVLKTMPKLETLIVTHSRTNRLTQLFGDTELVHALPSLKCLRIDSSVQPHHHLEHNQGRDWEPWEISGFKLALYNRKRCGSGLKHLQFLGPLKKQDVEEFNDLVDQFEWLTAPKVERPFRHKFGPSQWFRSRAYSV